MVNIYFYYNICWWPLQFKSSIKSKPTWVRTLTSPRVCIPLPLMPRSTLISKVTNLTDLEAPSQDKFPNTFYWYFFVRNFTDTVLKSWIQKAEGKTAKKEDGDDLFDEKKPAKK